MLTAPSALWCCSSPPGASSQPAWHLTSTPCHESFPACTSWHWMPRSTAGEWPQLLPSLSELPTLKGHCGISNFSGYFSEYLKMNPHFSSFLSHVSHLPSTSLSTRFGTVAVPNILLFQGAKPMARFNHTDRTLETLTSFIANQTGTNCLKQCNFFGLRQASPTCSADFDLSLTVSEHT